jgi:tripartite-type tricarboxylate transporter receptor subunit TctC
VKVVVPFPPGGGTDVVVRLVAGRLAELWQQTVIVENKSGADSIIGTAEVARAKPDGYTLLANISLLVTNQSLRHNLPFDTFRDLLPVAQLTSDQLYFAVSKSLGVSNLADFIKLAKTSGRKLNFGSYGNGSTPHLLLIALRQSVDVDITHVPYRGSAPVVQALMSGDVDCGLLPYGPTQSAVNSGKVILLAATGAERSSLMPQVSTFQELGLSGFARLGWVGLFLPSKTPNDVVQKIVNGVNEALSAPELRDKFHALGFGVAGGGSEAFTKRVMEDFEYYSALIKQGNVTID